MNDYYHRNDKMQGDPLWNIILAAACFVIALLAFIECYKGL